MRIISGIYKGRKLKASDDLSIRPTTDRVKEYIFNVLQDFPVSKNVVDIFSGSGNLGLEALSRGARHITYIEKNSSSIQVLKQNLSEFKLSAEQYNIVHMPAEEFPQTNHSEIELYLLDPPFIFPGLQQLIDDLTQSEHFSFGNLIVLEHENINPIKLEAESYTILKQKKMGRSLISFIEKRGNYEQ